MGKSCCSAHLGGQSKKKGVLILAPFFRPSVGGAETYADELSKFAEMHQYNVFVLAYQPINVAGVRGEKVEKCGHIEIRRTPWIGHDLFHRLERFPVLRFLYLTSGLFLVTLFWMMKHGRQVDLIDAHGLNAAFIAKIMKKLFKKRTVATILALYNFVPNTFFSNVVRWTLESSDRILIEKGKSRDELLSIGVSADKLVTFNQWVNQEQFRPCDKKQAKREVGWEGKFVVLFVGRALPEKGAGLLVEAAQTLTTEITFAFITNRTGPVANRIMAAAQAHANILFLGEVEYNVLHRYYQAADIVCVPSTYEEGVARVVAEAVSCGTPVIASNRGSLPSVLDESVSIIVEPTSHHFAQKVAFLYENPEQLTQRTGECWAFANENFGSANLEKILGVYDRLAAPKEKTKPETFYCRLPAASHGESAP